ncbi:hypothetical protein A9P82_12690 [Arachidicoccus ginsenosidimutans]|uniref:glycoside hydrolase family 76 protein n=1 Tax=Arachidicoccus sp. BS20 TaxID=1850526 RepID=UPI0007F07284|nr:glycoside hydrolase family 76 protein [Arachidicoccus sp. BS20]ANI90065.1 hypothetical protein A9P82_12690 [Arachidicoccus sp. BS20]
MKYRYFFTVAIMLFLSSCTRHYDYDFSTQDGIDRYAIDWDKAADSSTEFLINNFWNPTPGYFNESTASSGFQYWPQAHGLDVLIDAFNRSKSSTYSDYINKWYTGVQQKNGNTFIGFYYDDMGWNALAVLRAYQATNDEKFKDAANTIWTDIKGGWSDELGGGIYWNKDKKFKNTPANGPACIFAVRLYEEFKDQSNLDWAVKDYNWLKDSLTDPNGFVYDGINTDGSRSSSAFTYNQGLMIGAANELYNATKDPAYLNDAQTFANYALNNTSYTTADRLLIDEGKGDGGLFNGIFIRYFTQLIANPDLDETVRKRYIDFLKLNAETLWYAGANKQAGLYGTYWKNPPTDASVDLTVEESGCMLIEAAALLNQKQLL